MADAKRATDERVTLVKSCASTLELMRAHVTRANLGEGESARELRDFLDLCWLAAMRLQEDLAASGDCAARHEKELRPMA